MEFKQSEKSSRKSLSQQHWDKGGGDFGDLHPHAPPQGGI